MEKIKYRKLVITYSDIVDMLQQLKNNGKVNSAICITVKDIAPDQVSIQYDN
jgi:hypothetical protein